MNFVNSKMNFADSSDSNDESSKDTRNRPTKEAGLKDRLSPKGAILQARDIEKREAGPTGDGRRHMSDTPCPAADTPCSEWIHISDARKDGKGRKSKDSHSEAESESGSQNHRGYILNQTWKRSCSSFLVGV